MIVKFPSPGSASEAPPAHASPSKVVSLSWTLLLRVLYFPSRSVLPLPPPSNGRLWSISMIPHLPGLTVSVLPYTSTSCDAAMRMSSPQNHVSSDAVMTDNVIANDCIERDLVKDTG